MLRASFMRKIASMLGRSGEWGEVGSEEGLVLLPCTVALSICDCCVLLLLLLPSFSHCITVLSVTVMYNNVIFVIVLLQILHRIVLKKIL